MTTALIPLDSNSKLPAHLQAFATEGNEFGFSGALFPTISIKGKVFTIVRQKERTLVTKPGGDGEPASGLEVVILNVGPKQGYQRTFFAEGYTEGSAQKPTCHSLDGVSPVSSSVEKQASKCALCPQNAVGSGATQQNPKAKACKSSKVLAVAPAGQLNDPMMLRVPGASTVALSEYGEYLAKRGVKAAGVVTRIGFDYSVAHPALTFKALGGITPEMVPEVTQMREAKIVKQMVGEAVAEEEAEVAAETETQTQSKPAPTSTFVAPAAPASATPAVTKPKTVKKSVKVEAPVEATPPAVDAALDDLDFDD